MPVSVKPFGKTQAGALVDSYLLTNGNGMRVELISYGAAIRTIELPDGSGGFVDVALGYDSLPGYEQDVYYFGASIGRVANRIRDGRFTLNGKKYNLEKNNDGHHLHGGNGGFHKQIWTGKLLTNGVAFTYYSPDGEEGYPGGLVAAVRYLLREDNKLLVSYCALAEQDTLCSLANHCYFNLSGHNCNAIDTHSLKINASFFTANGPDCVATGEIRSVAGTPMDFRQAKPILCDLNEPYDQLAYFGGYDVNYVLDKEPGIEAIHLDECPGAFYEAACVEEAKSGRCMRVYTDMPGAQLFTANGTEAIGKGGARYGKHSAFCLETQLFPNGINLPQFKGPVLKAGESFFNNTIYQFEW